MPAPRVLVIQHQDDCPPALIGGWLTGAGAALDVRRPAAGDPLPADLSRHDAVLVLGGSMGAHDDEDHPWLAPTRALVALAANTGVPTLGICLGHQLCAVALGGRVAVNPRGQQVGVLDVGWPGAAADDALLGPLAGSPARGVQWNDDVVADLPPGAVVLAETAAGEVQAVRFAPTVWGVQLHPEADQDVVGVWARWDRERHLAAGVDQGALLAQVGEARAELADTWAPVATRLVVLAAGGAS